MYAGNRYATPFFQELLLNSWQYWKNWKLLLPTLMVISVVNSDILFFLGHSFFAKGLKLLISGRMSSIPIAGHSHKDFRYFKEGNLQKHLSLVIVQIPDDV